MSDMERPAPAAPSSTLSDHYRRMLSAGPRARAGGLESLDEGPPEADLSDAGIDDRLDRTTAELRRIVTEHLGDRPELHEIARKLVADGGEALRILRDDDAQVERDPELLLGLETIVRTDGSRPSFMVRDDEPDRTTSPLGTWGPHLTASADQLHEAITCVGRMDVPGSTQGFEGTGFLIHEDLVITNRHVLQAIADPDADGVWRFKDGAAIDFGHEFRGRDSVSPRRLRRVVFCGSKPIVSPIDHTKLDLALIELEPVNGGPRPRTVLALDISPDWAQLGQITYTVGYPGRPPFGSPFTPTLLEQLFQSTFGCKRVAPGLIMAPQAAVHTWTLGHDATTLGGNSGSVLLVAGREGMAAGLHYGGRSADPRENWGHVIGRLLDESTGCSNDPKTLREHLHAFGVTLIDRTVSPTN